MSNPMLERVITVITLCALGYIIYQGYKGKKVLENLKETNRKFIGGKNNGGI